MKDQLFRCFLVSSALSAACMSFAQWPHPQLIGQGGESTVATDGKGDVYVTVHQPCKLYDSRDWGATFKKKQAFDDAFCDMDVLAQRNGDVNVSYIKRGVSGFASYFSTDYGHTMEEGSAPSGPLDREWLAANPRTGDLYMDYSNGYIGGPKSIGVFLAGSTDHGKSFTQLSRCDNEPAGNFPVDPYLQSSTDGRLYAMWSTSQDYDTIDRFDFSYSTDGGHTFEGHQTIASLHKQLGDTQERWILGCISASGSKKLLAIFPDYTKVEVDGTEYKPLLLYYRLSTDGGKSFSDPRLVSSMHEIQGNIRRFEAAKKSNQNNGYYLQTLPWTCADANGRFHLVYEDNRDGQGPLENESYDKWQVRAATLGDDGFSSSEQVSHDVVCIRPPLDFISCAADGKYMYVTWTEAPGVTQGWPFTGQTYLARKAL